MEVAADELTYVFDENSAGLIRVLQAARVPQAARLRDLPGMGISDGTLDADVLAQLGQGDRRVLIGRDGRMLEPVLQRRAWSGAGLTLFLLSKAWGRLPLFELSRRLLFLWPGLVQHAENGARGLAWQVSPTMPRHAATAFRAVRVRHTGLADSV